MRRIKKSVLLFLPLFLCFGVSGLAQEMDLIADGAELVIVSEAYSFTEGPAVDSEGNVFFTDQPNDRIVKWNATDNSVTDYMQPCGRSNGLYFDHKGNLLACADEQNELWQIDKQKNITVLVDSFENKTLGGPNDLWVDPKGGIYFTDPFYKRPWWNHTEAEIKERCVYFLNMDTKELRVVAKGFAQPNGIIGGPDGKTLYIADNGDKKTYEFTIDRKGNLTHKKLFVDRGSDGMTIDNQGNVYLTGDGVTVFNASGEQMLHIPVSERWTANVTFGGSDQKILFITAMDSIYTLLMNVKGVR